jgi:prepilin-type N-terminal cleavage/methylation domain-containing protein
MKQEQGFTLVEVIIAIIVLTVGLLGLVTTAALVTRMIARGQRSAVAATFAAQRLEQLRVTTCTSQASGSEDLFRGSTKVATNNWSFTGLGTPVSSYGILLTVRYLTAQNSWRTDTLETMVSCLF